MSNSYASFLIVRRSNYSSIVRLMQNRWTQTVEGYPFFPFQSSGILSSRSGGQSEISIAFPLDAGIVSLVEDAIASNYYFQLLLREFTPPSGGGVPSSFNLVGTYLGQVVNASYDEASVSVSLGSSLDPVEASAPPRKFTTIIAGQPPKL